MMEQAKISQLKRPKKFQFRANLFWDVDPKTIDPQKHARYIIERILDFSNNKEVRWMAHFYSSELIRDVVKKSRVLHEKTKSWRYYAGKIKELLAVVFVGQA